MLEISDKCLWILTVGDKYKDSVLTMLWLLYCNEIINSQQQQEYLVNGTAFLHEKAFSGYIFEKCKVGLFCPFSSCCCVPSLAWWGRTTSVFSVAMLNQPTSNRGRCRLVPGWLTIVYVLPPFSLLCLLHVFHYITLSNFRYTQVVK